MLALLWGILNITVIVYFLIICIKSTKIISEKLGALASLIFVFGLLSFSSNPTDEPSKTKVFELERQANNEKPKVFNGNTYNIRKSLEDNLVSKIELAVTFGENENGKKRLTAYSYRNGFVCGTNWKTSMIMVEKSKTENKCFYNLSGIIEWRLLGLTLYSEPKHFKGALELKKYGRLRKIKSRVVE